MVTTSREELFLKCSLRNKLIYLTSFKCQNAPEKSAANEAAFAADGFCKKQFAFLEN
jgi:hypothetical protein